MSLAEAHADRALQALAERAPDCARALESAPAEVRRRARRVFAASDFVADALARDERLLPRLLARAPAAPGRSAAACRAPGERRGPG